MFITDSQVHRKSCISWILHDLSTFACKPIPELTIGYKHTFNHRNCKQETRPFAAPSETIGISGPLCLTPLWICACRETVICSTFGRDYISVRCRQVPSERPTCSKE